MKSWQHRENKGYAYSNRKMAQDYIARVVLGRTKVGEDSKLAHGSSASSRRKKKESVLDNNFKMILDSLLIQEGQLLHTVMPAFAVHTKGTRLSQ